MWYNMRMQLFDTHAHFTEDRAQTADTLRRAAEAGVTRVMAVGGSPELNRAAQLAAEVALELSDGQACHVRVALGLDRDQAALEGHVPDEAFAALRQSRDSLAAIGEIGLDFHYAPETDKAQCDLFAAQLALAAELDRPVVIHTRDADDATLGVIDDACGPRRGIIHCFTGSVPFARQLLDRGFMLSFSGIVTFRAADNVRAAARYVPEDRLLIETDSPFLAPVPLRGRANEPAFLVHTLHALAAFRKVTPEYLAAVTAANAERTLPC